MSFVVLNVDGTPRSVDGVPWPPPLPRWATRVAVPTDVAAARDAMASARGRASVARAVAEAVTS